MSCSFSCRNNHALDLAPFHAAFLADDALVTIVPEFDLPRPTKLLSSSSNIGPFKAGLPTRVPLWLATLLHQRSLAEIVTPSWLDPSHLARVAQMERRRDPLCGSHTSNDNDDDTPTLPFYYYQLSQRLLSTNSGISLDSAQRSSSQLLVHDVAQLRLDKIRQQFQLLTSEERTNPNLLVAINGIASNEMIQLKPFITQALNDQRYLATGSARSSSQRKTTTTKTSTTRTSVDDIEDATQEEPAVAPLTNHALRSRLRRFRG